MTNTRKNESTKTTTASLEEARYKVLQAFTISPSMTRSMLNAIIGNRINARLSQYVIDTLIDEKIIVVSMKQMTNFHGHTSTVRIYTLTNGGKK